MQRPVVKNHSKPSITEKKSNKAKCSNWISIKCEFVKLWNRTACWTLPNALAISSAAVRVVLELSKTQVNLSDTDARRSPVD